VYQDSALKLLGYAQNPTHNVPVYGHFDYIIFAIFALFVTFDALKAIVLDPVHSFFKYMCIRIMP